MLAEAGAAVAVNDLDAELAHDAAAQLGGKSFAIPGNVTSEAEAGAIVAAVRDRGFGLDFLVNNAGVAAPLVPLAGLRIEDWQHVIDVNLKGAFLMCRAAAAAMTSATATSNFTGSIRLTDQNSIAADRSLSESRQSENGRSSSKTLLPDVSGPSS